MNICFIGSSGHAYAVAESEKIKDKSNIVMGVAPGSAGENVAGLYNCLCKIGQPPKQYGDWIRMLDELKPDIVIVDNYYGEHAKVSIEALGRGCHVLSEKPLAATLESLNELRDAHAKSNKKIAAMFTMRFEPEFRTAQKIIQDGAIGDIRLVNAQKSYKLGTRPDFYKSRAGFGGFIPWVGIHAIDAIYFFTGKKFVYIDAVCSSEGNSGYGDLEITAAGNFILEDGIIATMTADYLRPGAAPSHGDDRLRIAGSSGVLEVIHNKVVLINQNGEKEIELLDGTDMFAAFLDYVGGGENAPLNSCDAFHVTETAVAAQVSADIKRRKI